MHKPKACAVKHWTTFEGVYFNKGMELMKKNWYVQTVLPWEKGELFTSQSKRHCWRHVWPWSWGPEMRFVSRIGWPTLAWRRRRYKLFLFWQLTKGQGPPPLAVPACVSTRASQTLRKRTIEMPVCRLELRRRSFLPLCITLWNSLPLSITSCSSSSSFLSSLDSHFKSDKYCFGLWPSTKETPLH